MKAVRHLDQVLGRQVLIRGIAYLSLFPTCTEIVHALAMETSKSITPESIKQQLTISQVVKFSLFWNGVI